MTGKPPVYVPIDSTFPFFMAQELLKKSIKTQEAMLEEIDDHLLFDDLDAVSDCVDENIAKINKFKEEVDFCNNNRADILYGFVPKKKGAPKFRRYANNKRTYKGFGEVKVRKANNVCFSRN